MKHLRPFLAIALATLGQELPAQTADAVPTSLAWDVHADPRGAALGGADVAPLAGDGWTLAYHPAATDTALASHVHVAYLDYFAGMNGGAATLPLRARGRRMSHVGIRFASFGEFDGTTAAGQVTGAFSGGDYAMQYGSAWALDSAWVVGITGWAGLRNLAQVNAGVLACDVGVVRKSKSDHGALGLLVSNLGFQDDFSGIMPEGRLPANVQVGWSQTFPNAPFTFHLRVARLNTWELAPPGTYDDTYDPLTGQVVLNEIWEWGDQFARHLSGGVTLRLGEHLRGYLGYNHQRQKDMVAAGRPGINGLASGVRGRFKNLDFTVSRSVYHYAGTSTHLGLAIRWPESSPQPSSRGASNS